VVLVGLKSATSESLVRDLTTTPLSHCHPVLMSWCSFVLLCRTLLFSLYVAADVTRCCDLFSDGVYRPVYTARHVRTVSEYHENGSIWSDHGNLFLSIH